MASAILCLWAHFYSLAYTTCIPGTHPRPRYAIGACHYYRSIEVCDITLKTEQFTYDSTEKIPGVVVLDGNKTLTAGTDYTVSYGNNIKAGTASIEITGMGDYSGKVVRNFTILKREPVLAFSKASVSKTYGDKAFSYTLKTEDTDGTVSYVSDNVKLAVVNPATGKVTIKGAGTVTISAVAQEGRNYVAGRTSYELVIAKANNHITVANVNKVYASKMQTFTLKASALGGARLKFTSNNKSIKVDEKTGKVTIAAKTVGQATVTVSASETANYKAATEKMTITVCPAETAFSKVQSVSGGKAEMNWKQNKTVTGYQIEYSISKNFSKAVKSKTVKNPKMTKATISKLKKGSTYYVRIRTYKSVGGKKFYSAWSKVKQIKIKK